MLFLILLSAFIIADFVCRIHDKRRTYWHTSVWWEGSYYTHKAKDQQDALDWAYQYPSGTVFSIVRVFHGKARVTQSTMEV